MPRLCLLHRIMKITHMYQLLAGFLVFYLVSACLILRAEPGITTFRDSLWYCFVSCTTIGYGDIVAVTGTGRLLTALLALYGIIVVAFIPAVIVSYSIEFNKVKAKKSVMNFLDKLEHLDTLSPEELREISEHIKQRRYKL